MTSSTCTSGKTDRPLDKRRLARERRGPSSREISIVNQPPSLPPSLPPSPILLASPTPPTNRHDSPTRSPQGEPLAAEPPQPLSRMIWPSTILAGTFSVAVRCTISEPMVALYDTCPNHFQQQAHAKVQRSEASAAVFANAGKPTCKRGCTSARPAFRSRAAPLVAQVLEGP
jgi:hypothetical protein